jgi:hypothetical protein
MRSHHTNSCFFITGLTGDHNCATVHPDPHVSSGNEERIAVVTEPSAEPKVHPDPLAHRDPPGKFDITVTPFRMIIKLPPCLLKKDLNTFPGNLFCDGVAGAFFHDRMSILIVVLNYQRMG